LYNKKKENENERKKELLACCGQGLSMKEREPFRLSFCCLLCSLGAPSFFSGAGGGDSRWLRLITLCVVEKDGSLYRLVGTGFAGEGSRSDRDCTGGLGMDSVVVDIFRGTLVSGVTGRLCFSEQSSQYRFSPPISNRFGRITRHERHC